VISVEVEGNKREFASRRYIDNKWLHEQVDNRKKDGKRVCVQVVIDLPQGDISLHTPDCTGTGGRPPEDWEEETVDLWKKHKLSSSDFNAGDLIAFLWQASK